MQSEDEEDKREENGGGRDENLNPRVQYEIALEQILPTVLGTHFKNRGFSSKLLLEIRAA